MKAAFIAYRLVAFRVAAYFLTPFLMVILSQTETWSGETFENTHWFLMLRIALAAFVAGMTSLCAYIDQSLKPAQLLHGALSEEDRRKVAAETNSDTNQKTTGEQ